MPVRKGAWYYYSRTVEDQQYPIRCRRQASATLSYDPQAPEQVLLDQNQMAQGKAYLTEDTQSMSWIRRADLAALTVQALDDPRSIGKVYHAFDPDRTRFWSIPAN